VDVRELTLRDREDALDLWERCGLTRPWNPPAADFDRAVAGPSSAVLGVFDHDALAATVMVGDDGHRGWVYYVGVDPDRRTRGVGRAAMGAAEDWLRARGVRKVELMVRAGNDGAAAFYDGLGYRREDVGVFSRWLDDGPSG
jgi:ribosomal protein S18 acetylase RimI-like enzyme